MAVRYISCEIISQRKIFKADVRAVLDKGGSRVDQVVQALIVIDKGARFTSDGYVLVKVFGAGALAARAADGSVQPLFSDIVNAVSVDPIELQGDGKGLKQCDPVGQGRGEIGIGVAV